MIEEDQLENSEESKEHSESEDEIEFKEMNLKVLKQIYLLL
jgi:hypothetical protein